MRKNFHLVLAAASLAGLAACAAPEHDYYAYPDDYRAGGNHRGAPDNDRPYARAPVDDPTRPRDRAYSDRHGDRDGDGVLNWRDRYPADPRRF